MELTSGLFAGFVGLVLLQYYVLPRRAQNYLLLIASYVFYLSWSRFFPLVLLGLTLANFIIAQGLERAGKRYWLWMGVGLNLAALAFFKYADFFVPELLDTLSRLGFGTRADTLRILLPVGLSFYSLQGISYLVDVYRGQLRAATDPVDFALYMAYFPKLTAGPIERARSFLPKVAARRIVDNGFLARSGMLLVVGLVRKLVVADPLLAAIPGELFEAPLQFSGPQLAAWLAAYGFGLYNDFAGYTNVARGVSGLFGIELSRNFAWPLFARSFTEVWDRWHITLSHWLRDYIYFPLSRALLRRSRARHNWISLAVPPVVTMLASGIWHGSSANFLAWGGVMALFLVVERLPGLGRPILFPEERPLWRQGLQNLTVIVLGILALGLFCTDLSIAPAFYRGLFDWSDLSGPDSRVFLLLLPAFWIDWVQYRRRDEFVFLTWPKSIQSGLLALAILLVFLSSLESTVATFIYQQF